MLRLTSHRLILPTAAAPGRGAQVVHQLRVLPAEALGDYRHNLSKLTQVVAWPGLKLRPFGVRHRLLIKGN